MMSEDLPASAALDDVSAVVRPRKRKRGGASSAALSIGGALLGAASLA